jgi:hypothetical protein
MAAPRVGYGLRPGVRVMNKQQLVLLIAAVVNIALLLLFPPFDYVSAARNNVPTFEGFQFVFADHGNSVQNWNFLQIELFVVLINAAIGWLLLADRSKPGETKRPGIDWQRVVLFGTGVNLVLVLLFPPFQNYYAVTNAALPSFDGFYFLFGDHSKQNLVVSILYLEVIFVLVNGGLLWLVLRRTKADDLDALAKKMMTM